MFSIFQPPGATLNQNTLALAISAMMHEEKYEAEKLSNQKSK